MGIWRDRLYRWARMSLFGVSSVAAWTVGAELRAMAQSQIVVDETLSSEPSRVIDRGGANFDIDGGARRGANLFHSFQEFNVNDGGSVYFLNPSGIENILSRVTGNNPSNILGTLGVRGAANLFFINPNGILFGSNSRLDVRGSFVATTADAIEFGDRGFFNATNPETPSQLLDVDPSAFFFNQIPQGQIVSRSTTPDRSGSNLLGLRVPDGETLLLVGGNITLDGAGRGAGLYAPGGRVEIGSVAGIGRVGLNPDNSLTIPDGLPRGNMTLQNRGIINVRLDDGGTIAIRSGNIRMTEESTLVAGILRRRGTSTSQAGDITLDATNAIQMQNSSRVANELEMNAVGNTEQSGNIYVTTSVLEVVDGSQLRTGTNGRGNAGNVVIRASDRVRFEGLPADSALVDSLDTRGGAFSTIETPRGQTIDLIRQGGNVEITTPVLEVFNGAQLQTSTDGRGNAGNVIITATDRIRLAGRSGTFSSGALSTVESRGVGQGGTIRVETSVLEVLGGARLNASTQGQGNAGNIIIRASDRARFQGTSPLNDAQTFSGAFSRVDRRGTGQGGTIRITTPILEVLDGARLSVNTNGQGDAGNIVIQATDRIRFQGVSLDGDFSGAFSRVDPNGAGQGGNLRIQTRMLEVLGGAQLQTNTSGQGNAGNIDIQASDRVRFEGRVGRFPSGAFSRVARVNDEQNGDRGGIGQGGSIRIAAPIVEILNGARLNADTEWQGDAGSVMIRATDRVVLDGIGQDRNQNRHGNQGRFSSAIFTIIQATAGGRGGIVEITAPLVRVANAAVINAGTNSELRGADITINANEIEILNGGQIITTTGSEGRAGNITLDADKIRLSGGFSEAVQQFQGQPLEGNGASGLFASTSADSTGDGGRITVNSTSFTLENRAEVSAQSLGTGRGGSINLTAANEFSMRNADITADAIQSDGGTVSVTANTIRLSGDSDIRTTSQTGNGGNIELEGSSIFVLDDSDLLAFSSDAEGGNIRIDSPVIIVPGSLPASLVSVGADNNNRVDINATGEISTTELIYIEGTLLQLPDNPVNTDHLLANSCIARNSETGSFIITGTGGLPTRPGDRPLLPYETAPVRSIPDETSNRSWQPGEAIVEPQGAYQLEDGRWVLSRECD